MDELAEDARADVAQNALTVRLLVHYIEAAPPGQLSHWP